MTKTQPTDPRTSSIRLTLGQAASVRRYVDGILGLSLVPAVDHVRLAGTDDALACLGETIAAEWPANGYHYSSALWPSRRKVYSKIETALTVPAR